MLGSNCGRVVCRYTAVLCFPWMHSTRSGGGARKERHGAGLAAEHSRARFRKDLRQDLFEDMAEEDEEDATNQKRKKRDGGWHPLSRWPKQKREKEECDSKQQDWRYDASMSKWWGLLEDDTVDDEGSFTGRHFRRKFRITHKLFQYLLTTMRECRDTSVAKGEEPTFRDSEDRDRKGRPRAQSLEMKLLASLRILASGCSFEDAAESANISMSCLRVFFHKWTAWMGVYLFPIHCSVAKGEDLAADLEVYRRLGMPGAALSFDGVHVECYCPWSQNGQHEGKEGYPTRVFNASVNHSKCIRSCTASHPGTRNDKTLARIDPVMVAMHTGKLYGDVEFTLSAADGTESVFTGAYAIVDGGYHKWRMCQCPVKLYAKIDETWWSKRMESVRKDVECTFGILKRRFLLLAGVVPYRGFDKVDNVMWTCCVLHNLLLSADGLSDIGKEESDWIHEDNQLRLDCIRVRLAKHNLRPRASGQQVPLDEANDTVEEHEPEFYTLRQALIAHFTQHKNDKGRRGWLATAEVCRPGRPHLGPLRDSAHMQSSDDEEFGEEDL